jgi:hypothetical protein
MSAMGLNQDLICWAIGSGIRGRPGKMSKTCLHAHFANELENGAAILRLEISMKFREAINAGAPWAIMQALRNLAPWRFDRYDSKGMPLLGDSEKTISIEFVMPSKKPEQPPVDVTPPASAGPEQPITEVPRIEGPRPRFRTEAGMYEMPRDSIFKPPDPKGWMK